MKRKTLLHKILVLLLAFCLTASALGCSNAGENDTETAKTASSVEEPIDTTPHTKADGTKYRIAYVDYDEYIQASRQLYYILAGLEELGWIEKGSLPFTISSIEANMLSTKNMYDMLALADLGDYIEFPDDGFHYLAYEDNDEIAADLKKRAGKDIDMVITFGTSAGIFVKDLDLTIPMVDFSATDPVASGIIDSATEGSGNPNVWAQVEPSVPLRQIKYYYSIRPFKKAGLIVYGDETISGIPDIEKCAEELGFELVKYNIEEQSRESGKELNDYYDMVESKFKEMSEEDIDAFFMTVDLVNDTDKLPRMFEHLNKKNIPIFCLDDPETVKQGGLILILASDFVNQGRFIAEAIARILNGAEAGSLPCIYTSSPSIYFNYTTAMRIGYPIKFELLSVCDKIFT